MAQRILWDKFEAALLLDTYLKVDRKEMTRENAVEWLSLFLRSRRARKGLPMDEKFRNRNGIKLQLEMMENVMTDGKFGLKGNKPAAVFYEAANLYHSNRPEYDRILAQAKNIDFMGE